MAYIPPHKRHVKDAERPSPTPALLVPHFEKKLNLRSSGSSSERRKDKHVVQGGKIIYARHSISRWWAVGLMDDGHFPSFVRLEPISLESIERRNGEKPLVLVGNHPLREFNETTRSLRGSPWVSIAENIKKDLLSSFQNVRSEMESQNAVGVKPSFVARFGKILFHGNPSIFLDTLSRSLASETALNQVKRSFYTNIPSSYMETVLGGVIPNIGVDFDEERELYHVKVFDNMQPDVTISCKCNVMKGHGELELYKATVQDCHTVISKVVYCEGLILDLPLPYEIFHLQIELNQVRHLVVDISCLDKNLDLRLMLNTKRILTALTDKEDHSIRNLIKSAVIDPDAKGGLRWPLGKECFGDRYRVVGVWHTKAKAFKSSLIRLKLRHADRFDFRTSTGEVGREVSLKMKGIAGQLQDRNVDIDSVSEMLHDTLKLIWDHFLSCDCTLT
ncbi:hypothetical protein HHK36_020258 [Tetracentron sinense]|uniref:DUF7903 domain-containing protein n=1 Tax=Tetracentron sinense TaxID=13715 RepID=A0A834YYP1_TETSI|nr:hypothetical protein HHK36_020258 [Tetracentron sinense]